MATLSIELTNTTPTGRTYDIYIKRGNTVGSLVDGFNYYGYFYNTTGNFTISNPTPSLVYGEQYWIKIEDRDNKSFIIENIILNDEQYFIDSCTP